MECLFSSRAMHQTARHETARTTQTRKPLQMDDAARFCRRRSGKQEPPSSPVCLRLKGFLNLALARPEHFPPVLYASVAFHSSRRFNEPRRDFDA